MRMHAGSRTLTGRVDLVFFLVRLRKWWEEVFPNSDRPARFMNTCSTLIGIMHHTSHTPTGFSPFEYYPRLLKCDRVRDTEERFRFEDILEMLRAFQQEWQRSQQFLVPFDFSRSTGLCPDVVVEITQYLSLIDAINAFSINILSLLQQTHSKLHLNNPTDRLLKVISPYVDRGQIASLRITVGLLRSENYFSTVQKFDQVISLTVITALSAQTVSSIIAHLLNVHRLSLWYQGCINLFIGRELQTVPFHSITHLHIRCAGSTHNHSWSDTAKGDYLKNTTITSFTFDYEYYPHDQVRNVSQWNHIEDYSSLFMVTLKFIQSLVNIQRVRLFTGGFRIAPYFEARHWQDLIKECVRLDRVMIQLVDDRDFTKEEMNIERELRAIRPELIFRIKSA
jgi:hypothetical protein